MRTELVLAILISLAVPGIVIAQSSEPVDFEADVFPLFRQHCVSCHGPEQQMASYRLDRRSSALRAPGPIAGGNSAASRLYLRLVGNDFGNAMPPSGFLPEADVETIRAWIDQGAEWPEQLANERDLPPPDPGAVAAVQDLRDGRIGAFMDAVSGNPGLLNARGPGGASPFMHTALYADASIMELLLRDGADPNQPSDNNATTLMWSATDYDKTRLLLDHGAEVNVRSDDGRTPLFIAASRPMAGPTVKLLLEAGAEVNPPNRSNADFTPLVESARAGDAEVMQLLIENGAETGLVAGGQALALSMSVACSRCVDLLLAQDLPPQSYSIALIATAPHGNSEEVGMLLDRGADVNFLDPHGRTPLMFAAASSLLPLEEVRLLISRGADINAQDDTGQTALDIARKQGDASIIDLLTEEGASGREIPQPVLTPKEGNTVASALAGSIPLIQSAARDFSDRTACASCHNQSLPAMAVATARANGFAVDEGMAQAQVEANVSTLSGVREGFRQNIALAALADPVIFGYIMVGLDSEGYGADMNTDTVAMYIKTHQMPDGRWALGPASGRPPLGGSQFAQTALALRTLQAYSPNIDRAGYSDAVRRASDWLAQAQPNTHDDLSWQLLGLAWSAGDPDAIDRGVDQLRATQRSDGGWADGKFMVSSAYGTGQAMVALRTAGVPASDPTFQRGVRYLLETQLTDQSWYVATRALAIQPYFDNGFPHQRSQFISGAATSWATMALALSSSESQPIGLSTEEE